MFVVRSLFTRSIGALCPTPIVMRAVMPVSPLRGYVTPGPGSKSRRVPVPVGVKPTIGAYSIKDNPGARKKKKRVGRGLGGGRGKTSGRGHKGYNARASKSRPVPGFEGGQAGILKAIPQLGNNKGSKPKIARVHLDTIQHWIDRGRLNAGSVIGIRELVESGCIKTVKDGVVILARGGQFLKSKIELQVTHASQRSIALIEAQGGSVTCFDYDRKTIRALLHPEKFLGAPAPSSPFSSSVPSRYFDAARRGYLAGKVDQIMERVNAMKEKEKERARAK
ncbi:YmL10 [Chytriomyces hyalinus]|nr:YmL10 [Chytriomyces hyalinus]